MKKQSILKELEDENLRLKIENKALRSANILISESNNSALLFSVFEKIEADICVFEVSLDFNIVRFNSAFERFFKSEERPFSQVESFSSFFANHPDQEELQQKISEVFTHKIEDKSTLETDLAYFVPIIKKGLSVHSVFVILKSKPDTVENQKKWKLLIRISEESNKPASLKEFIGQIHPILSEGIRASNFFVTIYNKETKEYTFPYYVDKFDVLPELAKLDLKGGLVDYVRRTNKSLLLTQDFLRTLINTEQVAMVGTPSQSWLGVPLRIADEVIGVIGVQCYTSESVYTKQDQELFEFIADHIAIAIDRKQKEIELIENEERLEIAQSEAHVGHWELSNDSKWVRISDESRQILGIKNDVTVISFEQFINSIFPKDREGVKQIIQHLV